MRHIHFLQNGASCHLYRQDALILRPEMNIGSGFQPLLGDAHVAACGYKIEGLRPFNATRRGNGLQAASESKRGKPRLISLFLERKRSVIRLRSLTSIYYKMAFPVIRIHRTRSFYVRKWISEAAFSRSSATHMSPPADI